MSRAIPCLGFGFKIRFISRLHKCIWLPAASGNLFMVLNTATLVIFEGHL